MPVAAKKGIRLSRTVAIFGLTTVAALVVVTFSGQRPDVRGALSTPRGGGSVAPTSSGLEYPWMTSSSFSTSFSMPPLSTGYSSSYSTSYPMPMSTGYSSSYSTSFSMPMSTGYSSSYSTSFSMPTSTGYSSSYSTSFSMPMSTGYSSSYSTSFSMPTSTGYSSSYSTSFSMPTSTGYSSSYSTSFSMPTSTGYSSSYSTSFSMPMSTGYSSSYSTSFSMPMSTGYSSSYSTSFSMPMSSGYSSSFASSDEYASFVSSVTSSLNAEINEQVPESLMMSASSAMAEMSGPRADLAVSLMDSLTLTAPVATQVFQFVSTDLPIMNVTPALSSGIYHDFKITNGVELMSQGLTPAKDVDPKDWYAPVVAEIQLAGIMKGNPKTGEFEPEKMLTQAEFAKILANVVEKTEDAPLRAAAPVNPAFAKWPEWAADAVQTLRQHDIPSTIFRGNPNEAVTRLQLAEGIVTALFADAKPNLSKAKTFRDMESVAPAFRSTVRTISALGIMNGNAKTGNFEPYGFTNRAQVAKVFTTVLKLKAAEAASVE